MEPEKSKAFKTFNGIYKNWIGPARGADEIKYQAQEQNTSLRGVAADPVFRF